MSIANCVVKARLSESIQLNELAKMLETDVKLSMGGFNSASVKYGSGTRFLIFGSGSVMCHGRALAIMRIDIDLLAAVLDLDVTEFTLVNMVCNGSMGHRVRLDLMSDLPSCQWEPELFPGLYYQPLKHKGPTFILFQSGKFYATGLNQLAEFTEHELPFRQLAGQFRPQNFGLGGKN